MNCLTLALLFRSCGDLVLVESNPPLTLNEFHPEGGGGASLWITNTWQVVTGVFFIYIVYT